MEAGLDEAGCGPCLGPLVAGVVLLSEKTNLQMLSDSKALSEKKRNSAYDEITKTCQYGIGVIENDELDRIGLAKARRLVFHKALDNFFSKYPEAQISHCIIDGTIAEKYKELSHECVPKADAKYPSVSAASILAKVFRDNWIYDLCKQYPDAAAIYGWGKNKGYQSKQHLDAIESYGITKFHRKSFAPCCGKKEYSL